MLIIYSDVDWPFSVHVEIVISKLIWFQFSRRKSKRSGPWPRDAQICGVFRNSRSPFSIVSNNEKFKMTNY